MEEEEDVEEGEEDVEEVEEEDEEEDEELFDIVINGVTYCTDDDKGGTVWELIDGDGEEMVGEIVGQHTNGEFVNQSINN